MKTVSDMLMTIELKKSAYHDTPFAIAIDGTEFVSDLSFEQASTIINLYNRAILNLIMKELPKKEGN